MRNMLQITPSCSEQKSSRASQRVECYKAAVFINYRKDNESIDNFTSESRLCMRLQCVALYSAALFLATNFRSIMVRFSSCV